MKYLLVDVGSTYTKLNLIDTEMCKILASAWSYTTVETDVNEGFNKAYKKLRQISSEKYDRFLGASSASGGLKVVVVGFSKNLTTYALKAASLSSGARILREYYYELTDEKLDEIEKYKPDILLLCGGTDGGNSSNIIFNAKKIAKRNFPFPLLVCGNSYANDEIREIFKDSKMNLSFTENVMPNVNVINYKPLREVIGKIFIETITRAKGILSLSQKCEIFLPTPIAVQKAVTNYGKFKNAEIIAIDIGGATTDVYSLGVSYKGKENIIPPEIDEPFEKRTVEGDMGMRYSATALFEALGPEIFRDYGFPDALERCQKRFNHPDFIAESRDEEKFDELLGFLAAKTALSRHIGKLKKIPTKTRYIYEQSGKDLSEVKEFIGTGGVIISSPNPKFIFDSLKALDDSYLKVKNPKYLLDKRYILSSAGLISELEKENSYRIISKYLQEVK